jgi:hypothetical protein
MEHSKKERVNEGKKDGQAIEAKSLLERQRVEV